MRAVKLGGAEFVGEREGERKGEARSGRSAFSTPEVLLKRANSIVNGRPPLRGTTTAAMKALFH